MRCSEIGIVSEFLAYDGLRPVAWVDDGVGGQLGHDLMEAVDHLLVTAALEVGAALLVPHYDVHRICAV